MKRLVVMFLVLCIISCNSGIHETIYKVEFIDGSSASSSGYSVSSINGCFVIKSLYNNSVFRREDVRAIYPEKVENNHI